MNEMAGMLAQLHLYEASNIRYSPEIQRERDTAIHDLLNSALFMPLTCTMTPPLHLELKIVEDRVHFHITEAHGNGHDAFTLSVKSLRQIIKDYFQITRSYQELRDQSVVPCRLEAVDQGRRGIHNEAATQLMDILRDKVRMNHDTARRLFTLICVLHIREQSHAQL